MNTFLSKFQSLVSFVLTGFDRLRFQGESLLLNHAGGVDSYMYQFKILRKDFPGHCEQLTERLRSETYAQAKREGVPVRHLNSASEDKDTLAQQLAAESKTTRGRIALLSCQEMGMTYRLRKDAEGRYRPRKESVRCTHYYHYFLDERFGLCYLRLQSWFPFSIRVGLNGRHWLANELKRRNVGFCQHRNLITAVDDSVVAQQILDEQTRADWPALLADLVRPVHPLWGVLHDEMRTPYYWMAEQSELATDVVFRSAADLARWYPRWIRHSLETLQSDDILRYFGKKRPRQCSDEVRTDFRDRTEGSRIKHWYQSNSVKYYNKEDATHEPIALRVEFTQNNTRGFKVFRPKAGADEQTPPAWQMMRKGVADMPRRADVGRSVNHRVLESLATVADTTTLGQLLAPLGRPVVREGKRVARALNPLAGADGAWIRTIAQGDYLIQGFRNRDLRKEWFDPTNDLTERRRQSAQVTRRLGLLKAHGIIKKVQRTHRYELTAEGKRLATTLLAAQNCYAEKLTAE